MDKNEALKQIENNTEFNSYDRGLREKTRVEFGWEDKIVIGHIGRFTAQKNSVHMTR